MEIRVNGSLPSSVVRAARHALLVVAVVLPLVTLLVTAGRYLRTHSLPDARFWALYVTPLFLVAPLWARHRLGAAARLGGAVLLLDAGVIALSLARFLASGFFPFSGHMLFLTYAGLTTRAAAYRWLALLLLVETTLFKLWLWRDPRSWILGLLLGAVVALLAWLAQRRHVMRRRPSPR
jgi:hypothetical protein